MYLYVQTWPVHLLSNYCTPKYLLVVVDGLCVVGLLINGDKWDAVVAIVVLEWLVVAPWGLKIEEFFLKFNYLFKL